jgi:hypothetical protein
MRCTNPHSAPSATTVASAPPPPPPPPPPPSSNRSCRCAISYSSWFSTTPAKRAYTRAQTLAKLSCVSARDAAYEGSHRLQLVNPPPLLKPSSTSSAACLPSSPSSPSPQPRADGACASHARSSACRCRSARSAPCGWPSGSPLLPPTPPPFLALAGRRPDPTMRRAHAEPLSPQAGLSPGELGHEVRIAREAAVGVVRGPHHLRM